MLGVPAALMMMGMLAGANVLFAAVLKPVLIRLLPQTSARSFIAHMFSLYYLFGAALSGVSLALLFNLPCVSMMARLVMSLCCVGYLMAWLQLVPRLVMFSDRHDGDAVQRLDRAIQVLNTAQWAVTTAVFIQTFQVCG
ncbi:hypothetical protein ATO7_02570 [Oceanococcus atlanticus]|uniref:Uncharacterized protein n=1 Tax=Oceanococcus atlanticus TaxID=1317117 RepID=A0A1Y1SGE4_9GAMM|nr:DUF4149 domain-containing protein [Oceanococcus atlanticus]ORE88723.1 hypothetical protein ATO7_02570 [Oceanococcus atlanticus]RZO84269.1 MAG: DUF4149 domain-containing protein [Oceanococcus sp.]